MPPPPLSVIPPPPRLILRKHRSCSAYLESPARGSGCRCTSFLPSLPFARTRRHPRSHFHPRASLAARHSSCLSAHSFCCQYLLPRDLATVANSDYRGVIHRLLLTPALGCQTRQGDVYVAVDSEQDGWCLVESADGERGYVPESYLDIPAPADQNQAMHRGGASRIQSMIGSPVRGAVASVGVSHTDAEWARAQQKARDRPTVEALRAAGALPRGFRQSTLAVCKPSFDTLRLVSSLVPTRAVAVAPT